MILVLIKKGGWLYVISVSGYQDVLGQVSGVSSSSHWSQCSGVQRSHRRGTQQPLT